MAFKIPDKALKPKFQKAALEAKALAKKKMVLPEVLAKTQNRKLGKKNKETIAKEIYAETLKEKLAPMLDEVVGALMSAVREGDVQAIKEYFERVYGKTPVKNDQGQAMDLIKGITIVNYGSMETPKPVKNDLKCVN